MPLGLGGTQNLQSPNRYSDATGNLMLDIGINDQAITQMDASTPDNFALAGKLDETNLIYNYGLMALMTWAYAYAAIFFAYETLRQAYKPKIA